MRFVRLLWITTIPGRAWVGSVSDKHNPSTKSGLGACISSRITTVIHVMNDHQINYNCFNEPFAVSPYRSLYWDMHGLIFETSIWLLAGSTRFVKYCWAQEWHVDDMALKSSSSRRAMVHISQSNKILRSLNTVASASRTYSLTLAESTAIHSNCELQYTSEVKHTDRCA